MYAVLRAKICDRMILANPAGSWRRIHVLIEAGKKAIEQLEITRVGRHLGQSILRNFFQQSTRIVFTLVPRFGIEILEKAGAIARPAPPVIP